MAMIKCSECGKDVSDKAAVCPNCGNPIGAASAPNSAVPANTAEKPKKKKKGCLIAVIVVIVVICIISAVYTPVYLGFKKRAMDAMSEAAAYSYTYAAPDGKAYFG